MAASQDFRNGAATGTNAMAIRLNTLRRWGIPITDEIIKSVAEGIAREFGGVVIPDGHQ